MEQHTRTFIQASAWIICIFWAFMFSHSAAAENPASALTAQELAASLSAARQDGNSSIRMRMEIKPSSGASKSVLQLQIKSRRTKSATEVIYQILWPKERKGEAVLLRQAPGGPVSGWVLLPTASPRLLDTTELKQPLFNSDLSYEDVVDDFYAWEQQTITGTEVVAGVSCLILESKPAKARSSYGAVRSWVDPHRKVPLRVEKYLPSGTLARRIDTTRVFTDDDGRHLPANLTARRPGQDSITGLEGSRIRRDVTYADREFTPDGLKPQSE